MFPSFWFAREFLDVLTRILKVYNPDGFENDTVPVNGLQSCHLTGWGKRAISPPISEQ